MLSDNIAKEIQTKLFNILLREHERLGHAGAQLLPHHHYWPLPGKNLWKLFIREGSICFRNKPKIVEQLMRNLPKSQITPCVPFYNIGINYADSIWIRDKISRVFKQIKCYVYVCIWFSIWPIHIEAVTQLTSEVFIAVLRRFISRRGCPRNIYSDNGSNIIGATIELNCLFELLKSWDETLLIIWQEMLSLGILCQRSPNFKGIWETIIERMKIHLKKIVGKG